MEEGDLISPTVLGDGDCIPPIAVGEIGQRGEGDRPPLPATGRGSSYPRPIVCIGDTRLSANPVDSASSMSYIYLIGSARVVFESLIRS